VEVAVDLDGSEQLRDGRRGQYSVDGQSADATELPLDRVVAFDAMHFAWCGFYPGMSYVD